MSRAARFSRRNRWALRTASAIWLIGGAASAQPGATHPGATHPAATKTPAKTAQNKNGPIGFIADKVDYDRANNIVVARGHVQAWQDNQVLTADSITFDRARDQAVARGHVVMVQPDGQIMYADYAEISQNMRDGLFVKVSALLANNGRLVANAGRRVDGRLNELSRAVYTACNLCKIPSRAPEWQMSAARMVQDLEHRRIEYYDGTIDMWGVPVFWFPYMSHADPSVKRESGFLVPDFGAANTYLGNYVRLPYYWVINGDSDLTITPTLATRSGPDLDLHYRQRFNSGMVDADIEGGRDLKKTEGLANVNGTFALNDAWRYGFSANTVSSVTYLRDTNHAVPSYLESYAYLEGFGQGAWARVSASAFQSTTTTTSQSTLPYVLPRGQYSYYNVIDPLGGRLAVDTGVFNVLRAVGTNTDRANVNIDWQRPFHDPLGGVWNFRLHSDDAYYSAFSLRQTPTWSQEKQAQTARAQPYAALMWRMPLLRSGGKTGAELIEPIVQLVASPRGGARRNQQIPNEDSLDLDFSDANLFSLNRYAGIDRQDGGSRVDAAIHGAWYGGDNSADALFGESFRAINDTGSVLPDSGLGGYRSDYVGHFNFNFGNKLWVSYRDRLKAGNFTPQMQDAGVSTGTGLVRVYSGYFYSTTNPYDLYDAATLPSNYYTHRNEIYLGTSVHWKQWSVSGDARRDLHSQAMDSVNGSVVYDDECFNLSVQFYHRYTSVLNDAGATGVLFQITFKTVGTIGSKS